jgi:hypothetical protein
MEFKLESREGYMLATASGRVSLTEALKLCKDICDTAAERAFSKILYDYSAVEGELSVMEWYEIGKTMAEYRLNRSVTPE